MENLRENIKAALDARKKALTFERRAREDNETRAPWEGWAQDSSLRRVPVKRMRLEFAHAWRRAEDANVRRVLLLLTLTKRPVSVRTVVARAIAAEKTAAAAVAAANQWVAGASSWAEAAAVAAGVGLEMPADVEEAAAAAAQNAAKIVGEVRHLERLSERRHSLREAIAALQEVVPAEDFDGQMAAAAAVAEAAMAHDDVESVRMVGWDNPERPLWEERLAAAAAASRAAEAAVPAAPFTESAVTSEIVKVPYTVIPKAFDMLENEDKPIPELIASGEKIVFKSQNSYFSTDLASVRQNLADKSQTYYECKNELVGAPYTADVRMNTPYFRIQLSGNFTVPESEIRAAIDSKYRLFELVGPTKTLAFVTSYASIQVTPGKNGLGRDINIISADHCQQDTHQDVYSLRAVELVQAGGRRRTVSRKAKKLNRKRSRRENY